MKLLVSVRSAAEVGTALSGGADIIDAKEPSRGSLGAVSAEVLSDILTLIPEDSGASLALGDLVNPGEVVAAVTSLSLPSRPVPIYLKLGFAGVSSPDAVELLIETAVAASSRNPASALIVAVAYADAARAGTPSADTIGRLAARAGAVGVLLDTHIKDGLGLLSWIDPSAMADWVASVRETGLATALAGGVRLDDLEFVRSARPDVIGVRGAACEGGREGRVTAPRVRALRHRLLGLDSGFVQGAKVSTAGAGSRNA